MYDRNERTGRAGIYVEQAEGYRTFIPKALPPDPPIIMNDELADLLSKANRSLGRLDGSAQLLPNPDLFVAMYVQKEAILSSQIEGTQASLEDVLAYRAISQRRRQPASIREVINHIDAMDYGIDRLKTLPAGTQLLKELHSILLEGARGKERSLGEFRQVQNWIGPPGSDIFTATFVPPQAIHVERLMSELGAYLNTDTTTPILVKCGLVHAQFETIHPFLDGNGRLGRLLVTLYLCQQKVLSRPLLYLSVYYKQHREEYYDYLQKVRAMGDWEGWLRFFFRGIWMVSEEAFDTARQIIAMREEHRDLILHMSSSAKGLLVLDMLFKNPMIDIREVARVLQVTYPAASNLVTELVKHDLLKEITGQRRNRLFAYEPYLALLRKGTEQPV